MQNRSISKRHFLLLFSASAALAVGCNEGNSKPSDDSPSATVADAVMELERGLNACAEAQKTCAQSDAGTDQCHGDFEKCRDAAKADLGPKVDHAVNDCATAARSCREAATTDAAREACGDQLRACTGADKVKPEKDAGDAEHVSTSPVADCIGALHSCLEGDDPAKTCTDALRLCIDAAVGRGNDDDAGKPDGGKPDGAGKPDGGDQDKPDGGKPADNEKPDGGDHTKPDAGKPDGFDAGKPNDNGKPDAGEPMKPDAGESDQAACKAAFDACVAAGTAREECARARKDCR